jgi:ribosomal subunit interface protein
MQTTITTRKVDVPEALRERADAVVQRLGKKANRPTHASVIFAADHERATAEIILKPSRGEPLVATADAPDHRTALDRAAAKIRRQLDKATPSRRRVAAGRK